jgi:hypothetical protein
LAKEVISGHGIPLKEIGILKPKGVQLAGNQRILAVPIPIPSYAPFMLEGRIFNSLNVSHKLQCNADSNHNLQ